MNLEGLIPLLAGAYVGAIAYGLIRGGKQPGNDSDATKLQAWRAKWGTPMKIVAPFLMVFGIAELAGVFGAPSTAPSAVSKAELTQQLAAQPLGQELAVGDGVFLTMHRSGASDPIGDGWQRAASTEGGFAVELPLPFNDFRMRTETTDKVAVRTHVIGAKTAGLLAWSATCTARRDGKLAPDGHAAGLDKTEPMGGTPPKAYARTVEFADRLCMLIVEAQGTDPLPPEATRTRFFTSLKLTGKPVW